MTLEEIEVELARTRQITAELTASLYAIRAKHESLQRLSEEIHRLLFPTVSTKELRVKIAAHYETELERMILGLGDQHPKESELLKGLLDAARKR